MAYLKQTPEHKALKKEFTRLKTIQKSNLWGSLMRALCYPHKGMSHSHTYILTEWMVRLARRGEQYKFFEWVEGYRQHCDAKPMTMKGGRTKEISTPHLFTQGMFVSMLDGKEPTQENLFATMQQFLAPLVPIDVYFSKDHCPTLDDILEIYATISKDPSICGILTQKEDKPFRVEATRNPRWKDPGYVFSDPLGSVPNWETFPQNYDDLLCRKIGAMSDWIDILQEERVNTIKEKKNIVGRPVHARTEDTGAISGAKVAYPE